MYKMNHCRLRYQPHYLYTSMKLLAPWWWPRFMAETCRCEN